jgi:hypothetical protein
MPLVQPLIARFTRNSYRRIETPPLPLAAPGSTVPALHIGAFLGGGDVPLPQSDQLCSLVILPSVASEKM